ncbi:hypothetical protein HJG60_008924 [Phyllostomus discolor]|uniref:Uncharacterized protein n=1 Tax=Phyllostomus discolor TaxID=89673 RepID=A0A833YMK0_9CHIR|nr:hypothetical protein HJG60_008924 [Phyllostomus discolor]
MADPPSWDHLPGAAGILTVHWASDSGFGPHSVPFHPVPTAQGRGLRPGPATSRGRKTRCLRSAVFVCLGLAEEGGVPTSSPPRIPSVTQSLRRKPRLLGPFPHGTVSQAAPQLPLSPSPPFSPELGVGMGTFLFGCVRKEGTSLSGRQKLKGK